MTGQRPDISVWQLGKHRLACGDCTDPRVVAALMAGEVADMVFTDPPYGVGYEGKVKARKPIIGDGLGPAESRVLVSAALSAAPLRPGGVFYLCSASGAQETTFRLAVADAGLQMRQCLVWVKQHFVLGHHDYHGKHESLLYGWKDGARHYFVPDRTQHTVWEFRRPTKSPLHPTMKPVDLIEKAIRNSSLEGDIVYDGFGGSGSTLIACERMGRHCRMAEIDPDYCQTIIRRWEAETGLQAKPVTKHLAITRKSPSSIHPSAPAQL